MYDELARTQRRSALELLIVNLLVPSVLTTFVLQAYSISQRQPDSRPENLMTSCSFFLPFPQPPDVFPKLLWMPRPHHKHGVSGRVVLKGEVGTNGRIRLGSIVTVQTTAPELVPPARYALERAVFRPALLAGRKIPAWTTVNIEFNPLDDTVDVR